MSSVLSSQGVAFATAMVVSCTAIYLAFSGPKPVKTLNSQPPTPNLRSCLRKDDQGKRRNDMKKKKKKKKKRVQFAENVKETEGNGDECRKDGERNSDSSTRIQKSCRNKIPETQRMPANRAALYNGILRDRVHRLQCSY